MARKKPLPRGFGLWPINLVLHWLRDNGYPKEAAEIEQEAKAKTRKRKTL